MSEFMESIQVSALEWLIVVTALLGFVLLLQFLARNLLLKQRIGEFGIAGVLIWCVLLMVPFPRWSLAIGSSPVTESKSAQSTKEMQSGIFAPTRITPRSGSSVVAKGDALADQASKPVTPLNLKLPSDSLQFGRSPATGSKGQNASESTIASGIFTEASNRGALHCVTAIYVFGSLLTALWIGIGYVTLAIEWIVSRPANSKTLAIFEELEMHNRSVPVLRIGKSDRTFVFGIFRPKIVLSQDVERLGSDQQIRSLLLHELAHCQQGDAWGRVLFNIAMPVLYFHPLYWVCRRQSDLSAEIIADQLATRQVGSGEYVQALVDVCRQANGRKNWLVTSGYRGAASFFAKRMKAILEVRTQMISLSRRSQIVIALLTIFIAMSTAAVTGKYGPQTDDHQERLKTVRESLAGQPTRLDLAVNQLSADTDIYLALDLSAIRNWSAEHIQMLDPRQDPQVSERLRGLHFVKCQVAQMMDQVAVSQDELFEIATGQIVFAASSPNLNPVSEDTSVIMFVETASDMATIDNLVNGLQQTLPNGALKLTTVENHRCFEIQNKDRSIFVLHSNDQLMLANDRQLIEDTFSKVDRLSNDPAFCRSRTELMDSENSGIDIFGFVRPAELVPRLFAGRPGDPGELLSQLTSIVLKTLVNTKEPGNSAESFAFVVQEEPEELSTECWLGAPNDGLVVADILKPVQTEQWQANGPAGLHERSVLNIDPAEFMAAVAPVVDDLSGTTGSFDRALASLRDDPQGPLVDVIGFADRLDSRVIFSRQYVDAKSPPEWMFEIPISRDVDLCQEEVTRLLQANFDVMVAPENPNLKFWVGRAEEPVASSSNHLSEFGDERFEEETSVANPYLRRSVGIIGNQLIIASSPEMIIGMHDSKPSESPLNSTLDYRRVIDRIGETVRSRWNTRTNVVYGFSFERAPQGLTGQVLLKEKSGWRIHSLVMSKDR